MARKSKVKPDYGEGYCDGWMQCLERMANLASLDGQANEVITDCGCTGNTSCFRGSKVAPAQPRHQCFGRVVQ